MGSSGESTWRERRHKKRKDKENEREEERSSLGEGSYQTLSGASGYAQFDERDKELKLLRRLVRDLELKARGRHQKRDRDNRARGSISGGEHHGTGSNRSDSRQHRDLSNSQESRRHQEHSRSREYADRGSDSPEERRPHNAAINAMSCALRRATWSPFLDDIEWAPMLSRFTRPPFNSYDGKTDPVEHVNHYIQIMSLHTHNDALMCKVCP